jgi:uncharacterized protein (TIGR02444 family)
MWRAANSFWRFSLRTYRAPGVQEACLALQERCGADINLLLFCGWTGQQGRVLESDSLRLAMAQVGSWQSDVIAPLRLVRRGLKHQLAGGPAAALALPFRKRVAALELGLERVEQDLLSELESMLPPVAHRARPRKAIAESMATYMSLLAQSPGPEELAHLDHIVDACSPAERRNPSRGGESARQKL